MESLSPGRFLHRNLPNILSLSRLPLGVLFYLCMISPSVVRAVLALLVITAGLCTDYLDGTLARRHNTVSMFGKWIDPLADFVFFFFVYLSFYLLHIMPLFLFVLFLARELTQHGVIRPVSLVRKLDLGAKTAGKLKTVLQVIGSLVIVALVLATQISLVSFQLASAISLGLLSLMVAVSLGSLYWYVRPLLSKRPAVR
ncbi:MAG TPA: CDP-alcohol phosphatidyltransferase family protein [Spirochaetia bacterium]|nr:CDP-alcohol phosphatidyltransferase family protein [Spirochaetia bacterium]